jgi:hypothetical protein
LDFHFKYFLASFRNEVPENELEMIGD